MKFEKKYSQSLGAANDVRHSDSESEPVLTEGSHSPVKIASELEEKILPTRYYSTGPL